jgi:fructokinase
VSDRFIRTDGDGGTPIIVERITKDNAGRPKHSYSWRCHACGSPFPGYRPELVSVADKIAGRIKQPQIFFFDRASPSAIALAKHCSSVGALVVFEPSGIGNPILFQQAWEAAHIVKYSHERLSELPDMAVETAPRLQIETLGDAGLRYKRIGGRGGSRWIDLRAFPVKSLRDTAGAGDWCTAGIISRVGTNGLNGFLKTSDGDLREAIRFGQALAAWNCGFEGPRGGMYVVNRRAFNRQIESILSGTKTIKELADESMVEAAEESEGLCRSCDAVLPAKATGTHK